MREVKLNCIHDGEEAKEEEELTVILPFSPAGKVSVSFLEFLDPIQPQSKQSTIDLWFGFIECLRTAAIKKTIVITIIYVLFKVNRFKWI